MRFSMFGQSDTGRQRSRNEDAIAWDSPKGFAVLADGLGGCVGGARASTLATEHIMHWLQACPTPSPAQLRAAMQNAQLGLLSEASQQPALKGMATTVVAAVLQGRELYHAHIGDARLYRWRDDELQSLTRDHSLLQETLDTGLYAEDLIRQKISPHIVTRALGLAQPPQIDVHVQELLPGDRYMLCSDGLHGMLADEDLALTLQQELATEPTVKKLIAMSNRQGGHDNISVILIDIHDADA